MTARVLSRMLSFSPGSRVWISADPARHEGRDPQQLSALGGERGGARHRVLRHGERDDLDRRDHLPRLDDREGRQGAERHRLVDEVEPVEPVAVEDQQAARLGEQIGAAGEGRRRRDIRAGDGGGDPVGRLVLAQIAGSSRAATISVTPAAISASISAALSTRPFLSAVAPKRRLCARIAPAASPTGISPNFIPSSLRKHLRRILMWGHRPRPDSRPRRQRRAGNRHRRKPSL